MAEARHGFQTPTEGIHVPHAWEYADAATRSGAGGFVSTDVGKLARQLDDNSLWMLTSTAPIWKRVASDVGMPFVENVTAEAITGIDGSLSDSLDNTPLVDATRAVLFLNGQEQRKGAGNVWTVNPTTGIITWLAGTGTAVDLEVSDSLEVLYWALT
jgi:hypothetical protein